MKKITHFSIITFIVLASCSIFKKQPTCFCIVVDDVKYVKNGKSLIKPKSNNTPWYRYPNTNIHKGDTVEVCLNDAIQPKF
jgi:hypothetical protein